jgi:predicted TPR repeat methyltransferase
MRRRLMNPNTSLRATILKLIGDAFPTLRQRRRQQRWSQAGWDQFYSEKEDPFGIEGNSYEQMKFAHMLEVLDRRYERALEVGCSEGSFTELLSTRCDHLLAIDITQVAVDRAQKWLATKPWVRVERRTFPEELPEGPFDLVVCADVLYYSNANKLREALRQLGSIIQPGGTFLALQYLGNSGGLISGDEVHQLLPQVLNEFRLISSERRIGVGPHGAGYQLDRYDRNDA